MNRIIEVFEDQASLARRVDELKQTGYHEANMYVLAKGDHRIDKLKGNPETLNHQLNTEDKSLWGKLQDLMGIREDFDETLSRLGVDEGDQESLTSALAEGKLLLIIEK